MHHLNTPHYTLTLEQNHITILLQQDYTLIISLKFDTVIY